MRRRKHVVFTFKEAEDSIGAIEHITELTGAKVRIFLAEVAEGVSNYRSMHSLTQQVEHQYHGRFLIELIQNAHDAFPEQISDADNRIEIFFDPDDSPHGSLFVANDGQPFSRSNFERLSQLGQSDKDPQKSIGNKGIGFRSVLEISDCPEIYSRSSLNSPNFDGYCFAFRPGVVQSLVEPIKQLANGGNVPIWSVSGKSIVESWSDAMLAKFRQRSQREGIPWLVGETNYLSPYLLPVPLIRIESERVIDFESREFATVVRLPLKSAELRDYVFERMEQLSGSTVLFLEKIGSLHIRVVGDSDREFKRRLIQREGDLGGTHVIIEDSASMPSEYIVWKKDLHVSSAPIEFQKAVAKLPGRWPEIVDVSVSVAVRLGSEPDTGRFSIYLPTLVPTGSAVHVNAPFFGDMSRTSIPFEDAYNRHLLETAVDLTLEVVRIKLAGKGEVEACAIIDCLAPLGNSEFAKRWLRLMNEAALRASVSLCEDPLILTEYGWRALNVTSLIPTSPKTTLLTEEVFRRHATFDIFHKCLDSRIEQVKDLAAAKFPETGAYPLPSDVAKTIASVASELHTSSGDWNAFWRDVAVLLPSGQAELAKHAVLLGGDGALHRASEGTKVFFEPRQGTQDDSDVSGEAGATEVPSALRSYVAFLSDQIQVYYPNRPTVQTPVRVYLGSNGLVSQFRVETIFSEVLRALTPQLPAPIEGPHFEKCRDILGWAIRLMGSIVSRGRGADATLNLLRSIPVPCEGGWYPMREASFGEGWPSTVGETLKRYLKGLKSNTAREARQCLLLPAAHPAWGSVGVEEMHLLIAGGVLNGLRLFETKPNSWNSSFRASMTDFQLPGPPPSVSKEQWSHFVSVAYTEDRPPFVTPQPYEVGSIFTFPGMAEFAGLSEEARSALSELILQSLPNWGQGLAVLSLSKKGGQTNRLVVTSPLKHFLLTTPWMAIREAKGVSWARPDERWFVPADTLEGRSRHFSHLRALPAGMARNVGLQPDLASALRSLGMQFFDPSSTTESLELLKALTAAVGCEEVSDANVLLGQLRDAWQRFRPATDQLPLAQLAVRRRDKQLSVINPTAEAPAYLPDLGTYVNELEDFGFPVVAIKTSDAKDLRDWFITAYGPRIQLTSRLSLVPHVDDIAWIGSGAVALADSELGWLIRPLLVMVAAQSWGIHSAAFTERLQTLQTARVDWVPTLSVAVMRDDMQLATAKVEALWEPQRQTLVVTEYCRTHMEELSGALSQALKRDDLELPLRYVLRTVESADNAPEDIAAFLAPLRITPEQVDQVLEHLKGDVGHMSRLVSTLIGVLLPEEDLTGLQEITTEEELVAALEDFSVLGFDVLRVLQIARDSQDLFDFGRTVSKTFGEKASLARWNTELVKLGQVQLSNRNWSIQFEANLEEAASLVKRVAAHAIRQGAIITYREMWSQYMGLVGTVNLSQSHWVVDFKDTMQLVAGLIGSWVSDQKLQSAMSSAASLEELRGKLSEIGVSLEFDPDECGRKNHELVDSVARELERLRLAAWLRSSAGQVLPDWHSLVDQYLRTIEPMLSLDAFTRELSEAEVFAVLKHGVPHSEMPEFQVALDDATSLMSLRSALKLSTEELSNAEIRLDDIKAERNRRRSVVKVCGDDFDSSEENLGQLWGFLTDRISEMDLAKAMSLNLAKPTVLDPFKIKEKTKPIPPRVPTTPKQRQSKALDQLIGLAGEIHVFRMLRQKYGEDVIPSSAWISENSKWVFRFNEADDTKGCDFAFTVKGKQFRVEVKASAGDIETFTLGSSEIRLAMDISTKGKRRREVFILVHVKNALSAQPSAVVLPNPYDPKYSGMFSVDEAGARVRYHARR
jgi:hypothetical protein